MTPQLATKMTIYEPETAPALSREPEPLGVPLALRMPAERRRARVPLGARLLTLLRTGAFHRRMLAIADVCAMAAALSVSAGVLGVGPAKAPVFALIPLSIVVFKVAGLYEHDEVRLSHSTLDEAPLLLQVSGLMALGAKIMQPILFQGDIGGEELATIWLMLFAAVFAARVVARVIVARVTPVERCLIIGEPARAERIRDKFSAKSVRARVVATLSLKDHELAELRSVEAITQLVHELRLDRIVVAPRAMDGSATTELVRAAKQANVRVSIQPEMLQAIGSAVEFDDVEGMPLLGVHQFGVPRSSHLLKRAFDAVVTGVGLIVVAPVMAGIALAIRFDTRGPVLYRQVRVGRDGKHFSIYKFRTMFVGADAEKDRLRSLNEAGDGLFKIENDPRVTPVGRILRRTSLDELPQVLNVLRGEMSLVGPRPLVVDEDARVAGLDRCRLHLTPGMTGPWQILGRRVPMQEMVGIDYLYVANWSVWLDCKLLLRTMLHVIRRGNV